MKTRRYLAVAFAAALLINASTAMAKHMPGERHTWRTVFSVAGTFGGIMLGGMAGGMSRTNMSQNIATGMIVGGIGGGVGGFFLGRMVDKSKARNNQLNPDRSDLNKVSQKRHNEAQARAMDIVARQYASRLLPPDEESAPAR